MIEKLEQQLDSFDYAERQRALVSLCAEVEAGRITLPQASTDVNLHCHTFFSYNSYGYSPSKFAWLARKAGLAVAGVVDFDVLDAVDEFLAAAKQLGLKACAGMETRVFIPEFSTREINSPGEPGISYHMGIGFTDTNLGPEEANFLAGLKETAQQRNRDLIERVNQYLSPVELDYEKDVLPLAPSGNATERHICSAYARKAKEMFSDDKKLMGYWMEKLGTEVAAYKLPESKDLINTLRAKTMKQGGVGYVQPGEGSFPLMADTNKFTLAAGGIAVITWLNGLSDGEQAIEELLEVCIRDGATALNIIPDRNYTPGTEDQKLKNLYRIVELCELNNLPVLVGTEMNSPGQKFVDSFETEELKPLVPVFLKGAHIVYAHSVLQQKAGLGYTSKWASDNFESIAKKNEFFEKVGSSLKPEQEDLLDGLTEDVTAEEILKKIN